MKIFLIFGVLLLSLFLESTLFSLPLVLLALFLMAVLFQEQWVFAVAFFMGIFLDILKFHVVGESSIFFLCMLGIVFLYKRKYEIQSLPFIIIFSFLSSLIYALIFSRQTIFLEACVMGILSGGIFFLLHVFNTKSTKNFSMPSNY